MSGTQTCKVAFEIGDAAAVRAAAPRTRIDLEPGKVEQGLLKLVLALVELLRQLMEKQAMRRIDAGSLTPAEIDRVGTTLMQLEEKIKELQEQFEIDDLNINLGPLGDLLDR
jgi:Gas vesicle protein K